MDRGQRRTGLLGADEIIFVGSFVDPEMEIKLVIALKTLEVSVIELCEHDHRRCCLGHCDREPSVRILGRPWNLIIQPPLLSHRPGAVKQPRSINEREETKEVVVEHPELAVIAKFVVERFEPFRIPFFGPI